MIRIRVLLTLLMLTCAGFSGCALDENAPRRVPIADAATPGRDATTEVRPRADAASPDDADTRMDASDATDASDSGDASVDDAASERDGASSGDGASRTDGASASDAGIDASDGAPLGEDASPSDAGVEASGSESGADDTATVTIVDPAPGATQPGKTTCAGCPDTTPPQFDLDAGSSASYTYTGTVSGAEGNGTFYIVRTDPDGGTTPFMTGPIPTTEGTGNFAATIPLFCGEQLLKGVWTNASGQLVVVTRIVTGNCTEPDVRVTLTWDAIGLDWELHLIRPGGRINDTTGLSDCTWNTCIRSSPDWGVQGDTADNPQKDVDSTGAYGPENIVLSSPEAGRFTVLVEHWKLGDPMSKGVVIVNVKGQPTVAIAVQHLAPQHVWTAATIDWPAATVTASHADFDCTSSWSNGCTAQLP